MRKVYKALRIMEVHKKAEPRFARPLKPILPLLAWPTAAQRDNKYANNAADDTIIASEEDCDSSSNHNNFHHDSQQDKLIINLAGQRLNGSVSIGKVNLDGSFSIEGGNNANNDLASCSSSK